MTLEEIRDHTPWCCRHRWTIHYIMVVVTLELILQILVIKGVL